MTKIIVAVIIVVLVVIVAELYFGLLGWLIARGDQEEGGQLEVETEDKGERFATMCRDCDELTGYAMLEAAIEARDRHERETGHRCDILDFERPRREREEKM